MPTTRTTQTATPTETKSVQPEFFLVQNTSDRSYATKDGFGSRPTTFTRREDAQEFADALNEVRRPGMYVLADFTREKRVSDAVSLLNGYGLLNWKKHYEGNSEDGAVANVTLIISDGNVRVQDANEETLPMYAGVADADIETCMPFAYFANNMNDDLNAIQQKFDE